MKLYHCYLFWNICRSSWTHSITSHSFSTKVQATYCAPAYIVRGYFAAEWRTNKSLPALGGKRFYLESTSKYCCSNSTATSAQWMQSWNFHQLNSQSNGCIKTWNRNMFLLNYHKFINRQVNKQNKNRMEQNQSRASVYGNYFLWIPQANCHLLTMSLYCHM